MAEAAGPGRAAPRARAGLYSASVVVLCALITAGALSVAAARAADLLHLLLPSTVYFAFALLLTRNLVLATFVGCALLVGAIWSLALGSLTGTPSEGLPLAIALASVVSLTCIDEFEARVAHDTDAGAAASAGLRAAWRPAAVAVIPFAAALAYTIVDHRPTVGDLSMVGAMILPPLAALALVPALSAFVRLDERAITRVNQALEWRMQTAFLLTLITVPRWSLSASGIGLVVSVVSYFAAERLITAGNWIAPAAGLAFLVASLALARDWRSAIGFGFSMVVALLVGLWASVPQTGRPTLHAAELCQVLTIGFALMIVVVARDPPVQERRAMLARSIEEKAPLVLCAAASVLAALAVDQGLDLVIATVVMTGVLCALQLAPAVASALETVLPRKRSVLELYGQQT